MGDPCDEILRNHSKGSRRRFYTLSAGHVRETCWSNPLQMTGQAECKWVGKSVQLPRERAKGFFGYGSLIENRSPAPA